jgi:mRNA interferase MazF
MITSAGNRGWPGDVLLAHDHAEAGLPVPSVIRTTKIATIEARHAQRIGRMSADRWAEVAGVLS